MADVTDLRRGDRAQLFLVGALVIATILVVLAVLLNGAIYSENLATRGSGDETSAAFAAVGEVRATTGGVVDAENRQHYDTETDVLAAVENDTERLDELFAKGYGRRGVVIETRTVDRETGLFIEQNESGAFVGAGGTPSFTLAKNVSRTRSFVLRVNATEVAETSDPANDSFAVSRNDSARQVYVYRNASDGGNLTVAVGDAGDPDPTVVCRPVAPSGVVAVDLTDGAVDDRSCGRSLWNSTGTYDVAYDRGDAANGTYELTVAGPVDEADVDDAPLVSPAVYAVTVDVEFRSESVDYETRIRVAPGETDA
ncbi:hypothetical protein GCM10027435_13560 [Haloparvum alkalitolerans]|uniref:DUF7261 family protein n=1 Tax=Haloparvum alkalitolerans TaxID=1042953 RepID=UPI003CE78594